MASHMQSCRTSTKIGQRADTSRHGRLIDIHSMLDVAVIGAGPSGLSVAAALLQCKSKPCVKVFDHIPGFEECGAGLGVQSNGFTALAAIDERLCQTIIGHAWCPKVTVTHSLEGKVLKTSYSDYSKDSAEGKWPSALLMGWCELRNGLADHVPTTTVELGRRFSRLEQHQDHATVHFRSGVSIDAKIVVGADGIFSKVRQQTLNDGLPHFIGMVVWRARLRSSSRPDELHTFLEGVMAAITYPIGEGLFVWTLLAPVSRLEEVGLAPRAHARGPQHAKGNHQPGGDGKATEASNGHLVGPQDQAEELSVKERCRRVWGGNAEMFTDIINATDDETIVEHNMHVRHPDSLAQGYWGQGRVTLAGDAAHPLRPASGQGVNQALEDAVELAQAIQQGGLTQESLRAYEAKRIPRIREIMAASMVQGQKAYVTKSTEPPVDLAAYKHAKAKWDGTDNGAFQAWVQDRNFAPLSSYSVV